MRKEGRHSSASGGLLWLCVSDFSAAARMRYGTGMAVPWRWEHAYLYLPLEMVENFFEGLQRLGGSLRLRFWAPAAAAAPAAARPPARAPAAYPTAGDASRSDPLTSCLCMLGCCLTWCDLGSVAYSVRVFLGYRYDRVSVSLPSAMGRIHKRH